MCLQLSEGLLGSDSACSSSGLGHLQPGTPPPHLLNLPLPQCNPAEDPLCGMGRVPDPGRVWL